MKFKYFGLWVDEEHGLVIIRNPKLQQKRYYGERYRERFLVYDFDRLEVYSYFRGQHKRIFREAPRYSTIRKFTPPIWCYDISEADKLRMASESRVIVDALIDMYNKLLNNLFPVSAKVFADAKAKSNKEDKEEYQGLELILKLMWYLVKYPQVSYLLRDMPQMTPKFLRMSYTSCFSAPNWSPDQAFDLSQTQPHKMLHLPPSLYIKSLKCKTADIKQLSDISACVGTDYLFKVLEWSIYNRHLLHEELIFAFPAEFIRNVINHGEDTAKFVADHSFEIRDHCRFTDTDITRLSLKMSNLLYIVRNHNRIARRMAEIAREERRKEHEEKLSLLRSLSPHLSRKVDDYTFVLLTDIKDFKKEGKVMNNCVAGYSDGEYAILSMRKDNKSIVDIQYDLTKRKILQKFQSHNRPCTAEQNKVISKWLREVKKASKSMKQTTEKEGVACLNG
jgi:hypothetical protein